MEILITAEKSPPMYARPSPDNSLCNPVSQISQQSHSQAILEDNLPTIIGKFSDP